MYPPVFRRVAAFSEKAAVSASKGSFLAFRPFWSLEHRCGARMMANRLKHLVSKSKRRFMDSGYDLDLTCELKFL